MENLCTLDFYQNSISFNSKQSPSLEDDSAVFETFKEVISGEANPEFKFLLKVGEDHTNQSLFIKYYNYLVDNFSDRPARINVFLDSSWFSPEFLNSLKIASNNSLQICFFVTPELLDYEAQMAGGSLRAEWPKAVADKMDVLLGKLIGARIILNLKLDVFNVYHSIDLLEKVLVINRLHKNPLRDPAVYLHLESAVHPEWSSLKTLNDEDNGLLRRIQEFISQNLWSKTHDGIGFHAENEQQLVSIINWISETTHSEKIRIQTQFNCETEKLEKQYGTVFSQVFPHLAPLYEHCLQFDPDIIQKNVIRSKKLLDSVSPSFCLAKWTTSTLHLESGTTHSCHHPAVHEVKQSELKGNPSALHNTKYKIQQREKMMKGKRPAECDYCWNIEDLSKGEVSDRILKSAAPYSIDEFSKIVENPYSDRIAPRYIEISFSNKCQFKCSYCSADYSSTWMDELEQFGNYSTGSGARTKTIYKEEENPYVKAFWDWWPELRKNLHTLRVTGGEPLLSPSTFKLIEALNADPNKNLSLSINSNLGAPPVLFDKFVNLAALTEKNKAIKKLDVYTSIDAFGAKAEYIRHGLKHDYFWQNVEKLLSNTVETRLYIMCTFNALSLTSFLPLLQKIREINIKHRNSHRVFPLDIDFAYLRHPEYQAVKVLPPRFQSYMDEIIQYLEINQWLKTEEKIGFLDYHVMKMKRIREWMRQELPPETLFLQRSRFYEFFSEHDRRRKTNFLETFPEMADFWTGCKHAFELRNR